MATAKGGKARNAAGRRIREIHRRCKADAIQLVRFLYCGNDGVIRGKACHTRFLGSYLTSGIGLTVAMQSFNMLDQLVPEGAFGPVGEIIGRARLHVPVHGSCICGKECACQGRLTASSPVSARQRRGGGARCLRSGRADRGRGQARVFGWSAAWTAATSIAGATGDRSIAVTRKSRAWAAMSGVIEAE